LSSDSPRLIVFDLDGTLIDSRRDLADAANALLASEGARPCRKSASAGWSATARPRWSRVRSKRAASNDPPTRSNGFSLLYDERLLNHTRPYAGIPESSKRSGSVAARRPDQQAARLDAADPGRPRARAPLSGQRVVGGDGPFPRKPDPRGWCT
jgi:phosphoglycolate phosphatase